MLIDIGFLTISKLIVCCVLTREIINEFEAFG